MTADGGEAQTTDAKPKLTVKVSNVDPGTAEDDLHSHFGQAGPISSVHLQAGDSGGPGVAHVSFLDPTSVETALGLTNSTIKGSVVTVSAVDSEYSPPSDSKFYSAPSAPSSSEDTDASTAQQTASAVVKVSGVPPKTTTRQIQEFFSFAGTITFIDTPQDSSGDVFVGFSQKRAQENALLLTGAKLNGALVTVVPAPEEYKASDAAQTFPASSQAGTGPLKQAEETLRKFWEGTVAAGAGALTATTRKAKELEQKHQLTKAATSRAAEVKSSAAAAVSELQKKLAEAPAAFSRSVSVGTEHVSQSISNMDKQFHMTEKAQGVFSIAEQRISDVGSFFMRNKVLAQGRDFIMGTAAKVSEVVEGGPRAIPEVGLATLESASPAEALSTGETKGADEGKGTATVEDASAGLESSRAPAAGASGPKPDDDAGDDVSNKSGEDTALLGTKPAADAPASTAGKKAGDAGDVPIF